MKYLQKNIIIPAWISCRTYLFGSTESRTYISNEKKHTYVLLENLASDMWKLLLDGINENDFIKWTENNGVADQVNDFLDNLAAQGLIVFENSQKTDKTALFEPFSENAESDDETIFIQEMKTWLFEKKFMFSLFFELTYRCNLKCVHCYNPKDQSAIELDYELCKKAIDDAYDQGCFRITFSGGESTLHTRFLELVKYARNKRISVEIFTNGQVLACDDKLYNNILALYPYRICVSLYSTDKIMHERVTAIKGSFDNTDRLIRRLRKANVNVQIKNFLLNFNCMDCIKVKNLAKEIGATSVADISLIPTIEGDKKTMRFALDEKTLFELYVDSNSPLYIGEKFKPLEREKIKGESPCLGGFSGLCINPDGNVVICVSMPLSVGNLHYTSLKEIWRSAMDKHPDSKLYQWQRVCVSDCAECYNEEYCAFCNYCPGMGYLENGYLKKSDVQCLQAKTKMKAYYYLKEKNLHFTGKI